jgi:hypothetical protein
VGFVNFPSLQCILTLHHKFTIVTHLMVELLEHLKPFASPLLRSIGPSTSPFGSTPWITEDDEALSAALLHSEDRIRVATNQPLDGCGSVPTSTFVEIVKAYPQQVRVIVGLQKDLVPEGIGVEDILQGYRHGKILHAHSTRTLLTPVLKIVETPLKDIQGRNMIRILSAYPVRSSIASDVNPPSRAAKSPCNFAYAFSISGTHVSPAVPDLAKCKPFPPFRAMEL